MRLARHRWGTLDPNPEFLPHCFSVSGGRSEFLDAVRLGEGEPLVLLPGLAGGWRLLMPLARVLATRYEVVMMGLRGDRPGSHSMRNRTVADDAADVASMIGRLGLERPAVLGVSYGAMVGLELAASYPTAAGSLILYGGEARFGRRGAAELALRVLERFPLPPDNTFVNQFFNLLHGGRPEPGEMTEFVVRQCWETEQAVMVSRLRAVAAFDARERLDQILAPTLVLAGERDVIVRPEGQKALAMALPDAQFKVVAGAGHIGFLTERHEVARQTHRFLREAGVRVG